MTGWDTFFVVLLLVVALFVVFKLRRVRFHDAGASDSTNDAWIYQTPSQESDSTAHHEHGHAHDVHDSLQGGGHDAGGLHHDGGSFDGGSFDGGSFDGGSFDSGSGGSHD